jgi:hypothetical protein
MLWLLAEAHERRKSIASKLAPASRDGAAWACVLKNREQA